MTSNDLIGSLGVGLLLGAFVLSAKGVWPVHSAKYQGANALGAALACFASFQIDYFPFVVLEGAWCLVALWELKNLSTPSA